MPATIDIYIFLDSSPQVRGEELFAASFELRDTAGEFPWQRRYFPMLALQSDFMDSVGKGMALVFMIFLMVGPHPDQVIAFCNRVKCIVADMGTERKIARIVDLLPEFYNTMLGTNWQVPDRIYLFPLCVASPGWMHGWDIVLQRGLRSLSWFPTFIVGLRALVVFSRTKLWRRQA